MKAVIAYGLCAVGVPFGVGMGIGVIVLMPLLAILERFRVRPTAFLFDFFDGLGCAVAGIVGFRLLGLTPTAMVPLISGIVPALFYLDARYGHSLLQMVCWYCGLAAGWITYATFTRA